MPRRGRGFAETVAGDENLWRILQVRSGQQGFRRPSKPTSNSDQDATPLLPDKRRGKHSGDFHVKAARINQKSEFTAPMRWRLFRYPIIDLGAIHAQRAVVVGRELRFTS